MSDSIHIENIQTRCIVGILDREREVPQPVVLDIRLDLSLDDAGKTGDIKKTVDYAAVMNEAELIMIYGKWRLIESAALGICQWLLWSPEYIKGRGKIDGVEVRVRKPDILDGKAIPGVSLRRERTERTQVTAAIAGSSPSPVLLSVDRQGVYILELSPHQSYEVPDLTAARIVRGALDTDTGAVGIGAQVNGPLSVTAHTRTGAVLLLVGKAPIT